MTLRRKQLSIAAASLALASSGSLAIAQKKHDIGTKDKEIKIGNIIHGR